MPIVLQPSMLENGQEVPPGDRHAINMHFRSLQDLQVAIKQFLELNFEARAGSPRIFMSPAIRELAARLMHLEWENRNLRHGKRRRRRRGRSPSEQGMYSWVFPSYQGALHSVEFLRQVPGTDPSEVRHFSVTWQGRFRVYIHAHPSVYSAEAGADSEYVRPTLDTLHVVMHAGRLGRAMRLFWVATGLGLSTRYADFWVLNAPFLNERFVEQLTLGDVEIDDGDTALAITKDRLADLYSNRAVAIEDSDVFLYTSAMVAFFNFTLALRMMNDDEPFLVAHIGLVYSEFETALRYLHEFQIIQYDSTDAGIDQFERDLQADKHVFLVQVTLPSMPYMITADVMRLHRLSRHHNFILLVNDTLGTAVNLAVFPYCDAIITSLSKAFSGSASVSAGSLILNPSSREYDTLHATIESLYEDVWFPQDALVLEMSSANFASRVIRSSEHADLLVQRLSSHAGIKQLWHPRTAASRQHYEALMKPGGTYGFVVFVQFHTWRQTETFFNSLDVVKGFQWGPTYTNISMPFMINEHLGDMMTPAWRSVPKDIIRISLGIEHRIWGLTRFVKALKAVEDVMAEEQREEREKRESEEEVETHRGTI